MAAFIGNYYKVYSINIAIYRARSYHRYVLSNTVDIANIIVTANIFVCAWSTRQSTDVDEAVRAAACC